MGSSLPTMVVIAGLPRCGTTLLAALLAGYDHCTFITDYVPSLTLARSKLRVQWNDPLNFLQKESALRLVRDQLQRSEHTLELRSDDFQTLGELHRGILSEWSTSGDEMVGHKLILTPQEIDRLLEESQVHVILLIRDPRDSATSFYYRNGGGVEQYLRAWRNMVRFTESRRHPRLHVLSYEQMVQEGNGYLRPLLSALGLTSLPKGASFAPQFQLPGRPGSPWPGNSSIDESLEPKGSFDSSPVERWIRDPDSPIVKYAAWFCRQEISRLGYRPMPNGTSRREALRWARHAGFHHALIEADRICHRLHGRLTSRLLSPLHP